MAKYVLRDGRFVCKKTGRPMITEEDKERFNEMLKSGRGPMITSDIPDYISPVTGKPVSGRVARREDLRRNNCFEVDPPSKPLRERQKVRSKIELGESRELNNKLEAVLNK
jgi:hypothetical protein